MDPAIKTILEKNEKVKWDGKQDLKTSMVAGILGLLLLFIIGSIFYSIVIGGTCTINGQIKSAQECAGIMKYVAYALFLVGILIPIFKYLQYKVTHYAVTSKRVLLKSGLIGADMRSVYYDQIKSAFVNVGLIGKIFGTGSILIDTGRITQTKKGSKTVYDRFNNIHNPYEVYKILQKYLSGRKESLHSGRADHEHNQKKYKEHIQKTESYKR
ncbi:PH domain-containing protein [archaeon]|jgi:hypothetical protein|nr:PH domain-containing protein [archaeon]MBT6698581.1 PH domain-containing protein [archaeon]